MNEVNFTPPILIITTEVFAHLSARNERWGVRMARAAIPMTTTREVSALPVESPQIVLAIY